MDNRKLGWIAIGLGVLALVFALGGHGRSREWYNNGPQFYGPPAAAPQGPGSQQQWQPGPQGPGPQQGYGPQGGYGPRERWKGGHYGDFGPGGPRHFGGWFLFPFMLIGGLFRLALFALLIMLAVRWFRGRGRNGTQDPPSPPSQEPPGPEQPPYTGGTQAL